MNEEMFLNAGEGFRFSLGVVEPFKFRLVKHYFISPVITYTYLSCFVLPFLCVLWSIFLICENVKSISYVIFDCLSSCIYYLFAIFLKKLNDQFFRLFSVRVTFLA